MIDTAMAATQERSAPTKSFDGSKKINADVIGPTVIYGLSSSAKIDTAKKTYGENAYLGDSQASHIKASQLENIVSKFLRPAVVKEAKPSFSPIQEWEGRVTSVEGECFTALLLDITGEKVTESEVAEMDFSDLSSSDKNLVKEGAIFRYVVGYFRLANGQKFRTSNLAFRRWSPSKTASEELSSLPRIQWE